MSDLVDDIERGGRRWHGEDVRIVSVRWEPYKKDGRRQMGVAGRWQEHVGAGDFWRWSNCPRPTGLRPALDLSAVEALEAENKRLREALALYASDENWKLGGPLDPNSPNFAGTSSALAALKEPPVARLIEAEDAP